MPGMTRREVLAAGVGASALGTLTGAARPDLVRVENEKPGTTDWQLSYAKLDPKAKYRSPRIEGYCSRTSPWPPSVWSG